MSTERSCDLCYEPMTNETTDYDLGGRYEFRLVRAKKVTWWRWSKEVRDLDVCDDCVSALAKASASAHGTGASA